MTMTAHPNPHRYSILEPGEYTHIGEFYHGTDDDMTAAYAAEHRHLDEIGVRFPEFNGDTGNVEYHRNGTGCAHCGARFAYGSIFEHPEHGYVAIGHTCAADRFSCDTRIQLRQTAARKTGEKARQAAKAKAAFYDSLSPELLAAFQVDHHIITSIRANGERYGSISERQGDLVLKLAVETLEAAELARDEPETPDEVPVPETDLATITGTVISVKWKDSDYSYNGGSLKLTVEVDHPDGVYILWGTCPAAISDAERGQRIRMTVRDVERSTRDESFGFYKRPTKATIVDD